MLDFSQKLALDLNNSLKRYIRIVKSLLPLSLTNTELMSNRTIFVLWIQGSN